MPQDVEALRAGVKDFFEIADEKGRKICDAVGVYAFYDYDGEPIYVGQTWESLRTRIRRHLTNQRTDAVAMNVLDPFEVAEMEVWPLFGVAPRKLTKDARKALQDQLSSWEFTVYEMALAKSRFHAVLNEKDILKTDIVTLPRSYRGSIIPKELYEVRRHPDVRIARRAQTIASLAKVISERDVSKGLRRTLVTQAQRLQQLAEERLKQMPGIIPVESQGTGEDENG